MSSPPLRNEPAIGYDRFFQTSTELLCVLRGDGRILLTNPAFREVLGYPEESLQGADFASLVHPEDAAPLRAFLGSTAVEDAVLRLDARLLHGDRSHRRVLFSLRRGAGEAEVYGAGIVVGELPVADEWQRRELLQKMQIVAQIGGWEVNCLTWDQYWTEETYRIHELPFHHKPTVDTGVAMYALEDQEKIATAFNACVTEAKPYDLELRIITTTGRSVWVRTAATPIVENGKVVRVVGAFQNIDEYKRRELELQEKVAIIERQQSEIQALSAPIIQVWDDVLALPLIGGLDPRRAAEITERLLDAVVTSRARYAILDLTGVEAVDEGTADHLVRILRAIQLLGAEGLVTGIRPAVAQTFTSLGAGFGGARTLSNLREAITVCMRERASLRR